MNIENTSIWEENISLVLAFAENLQKTFEKMTICNLECRILREVFLFLWIPIRKENRQGMSFKNFQIGTEEIRTTGWLHDDVRKEM